MCLNRKLILLILFLSSPIFSYAKKAHISDVLEGKASASEPVFDGVSKKRKKPKTNLAARSEYEKRREQARLDVSRARKEYPEVDKLYNETQAAAKKSKSEDDDESGTDLALKRLAAEFEKQFLTLMWQYASGNVGEGQNFASGMWNSRWRESIIDAGTEMGEIGEAVYDELKRVDIKRHK